MRRRSSKGRVGPAVAYEPKTLLFDSILMQFESQWGGRSDGFTKVSVLHEHVQGQRDVGKRGVEEDLDKAQAAVSMHGRVNAANGSQKSRSW